MLKKVPLHIFGIPGDREYRTLIYTVVVIFIFTASLQFTAAFSHLIYCVCYLTVTLYLLNNSPTCTHKVLSVAKHRGLFNLSCMYHPTNISFQEKVFSRDLREIGIAHLTRVMNGNGSSLYLIEPEFTRPTSCKVLRLTHVSMC